MHVGKPWRRGHKSEEVDEGNIIVCVLDTKPLVKCVLDTKPLDKCVLDTKPLDKVMAHI